MENNWRFKSIQALEKDHWPEPTYDSHLVTRCHALRKIPLNEFTIEDLRIMIGQQISLPYLVPLAIERLKENILAEGDFYPGDLLINITQIPIVFWDTHPSLNLGVKELILCNRKLLDNEGLNTAPF